jgi:hypothetical protein
MRALLERIAEARRGGRELGAEEGAVVVEAIRRRRARGA